MAENRHASKLTYRASAKGRWQIHKQNANLADKPNELTFEQFELLTSQPCEYCGQYSEGKDYCGIDRLDNSKGYTVANSIAMCWKHNREKGQISIEFARWIVEAYDANNS